MIFDRTDKGDTIGRFIRWPGETWGATGGTTITMTPNGQREPVSRLCVYERTCRAEGKVFRLGGIGAVYTDNASRRKGHASALIAYAETYLAKERGCAVLALFSLASGADFYRGRGWNEVMGKVTFLQHGPRPAHTLRLPILLMVKPTRFAGGHLHIEGYPW
jgi:GNAT superfamily N-acetyltransferase